MKNCNCKEKETTTQCTPNPCDFVYKMPVDECTNKTVYYITLASAVLMSCNDEETVEHVLNQIRSDLTDLNYITNDNAWQTLIGKITNYLKTHLTDLDPQLRTYVNNLITEYFDNIDFDSLNALFTNLFADWKDHLDSLLESIAGSIQFDNTPTLDSNNAVTSDGIAKSLNNKQDKINDLTTIRNNAADAVKNIKFEYTNSNLIKDSNKIATFGIPMTGVLAVTGEKDMQSGVSTYLLGCNSCDINGDGVVDIVDLNIMINIMLGKDSPRKYLNPDDTSRADVTGKGRYDIADVNMVLNAMLGKIDVGYYFKKIEKSSDGTWVATNETWKPIKGLTYYNISTGRPFVIYDGEINGHTVEMYWDESKVDDSYNDINTTVNTIENPENIDNNNPSFGKRYFDHILDFNTEGQLANMVINNIAEETGKALFTQYGKIGTAKVTVNTKDKEYVFDSISNTARFNNVQNADLFQDVNQIPGTTKVSDYMHACQTITTRCQEP